jgi:hypothetical protein
MSSTPGLEIPIEFKHDDALVSLRAIQRATKAAGDESKKTGKAGKDAADDWKHGYDEATQSVDKGSSALAKMMTAQWAMHAATSAYKYVVGGLGEEYKRQAEYVKSLANDFADLRKGMQEVATLSGRANSNEFTVEQAEKAAKFNLSPEERKNAQSEFLNFAGAQIGDEQGKKLTGDQADDFSSRIAVMMKSAGYAPAAGMRLGGSILQQKTGKQDVDKLMKEFSVAFQVMEKGQVAIERAAPEVAELMAMGVSSADAAKMFSVAAPAAPGQEGASIQAAMRAIEEMKVAGKEKEFGVTNDMNPYQSVKAFSENLGKRKTDLIAGGASEEAAKTELAKQLKTAGVAGDVRERRGLIAGFGRMGHELGGFKTYEDIEKGTTATFEADRRKMYDTSAEGKRSAAAAQKSLERAKRGALHADVDTEHLKSEAEVVKSGREEKTGWSPFLEDKIRHGYGWETAQKQRVNETTLRRLRTQAQDLGIASDAPGMHMAPGAASGFSPQFKVNEDANALLKTIADATKKTAEQGKPNLAAPPPGGAGKRQ